MITSTHELAINGGPKTRTRPWPDRSMLGPEEKAAVDALFDHAIAAGQSIGYGGAVEQAYCVEFAGFMGGGFATAVSSGTAAVYVALRALDLEPFTEVIVSCITAPGGMMPIVMQNCIPVVADAAPGGYNIGPEQVRELISPLTSAIVVAHIGGEPADMHGIMAVAREHGLPVVEDCAQSHCARLNGKLVGTFGDIAAFSTMFSKHHCTGGQGGMVYTRNESLYWKARRVADRGKPFGLPDGSSNSIASLNFNLSNLAAAIGRVQLWKLPRVVQRHKQMVAQLSEGLTELRALRIPPQLPGAAPSYWFLRLEVNATKLTCDKQTFCQALAAEGIPIDPCYRSMPHTYDWFKKRQAFGSSGYPWSSPHYRGDPDRQFQCLNAMAATATQFNLMVHEGWGEEEIADTVDAMRKVEAAL